MGAAFEGVALDELLDERKEPCRDFQRGSCVRTNCPYSHGASSSSENYGGSNRPPMRGSRSSERCRDFSRGGCRRGVNCPFVHIYRGREVCKKFNRGLCTRGNSCTYEHVYYDEPEGHSPTREPYRKRPRMDSSRSPPPRRHDQYVSMSEYNILKDENNALQDEIDRLIKENDHLREELDKALDGRE